MKFLHIADVHLGAVPDSNMPWGVEREKEIWNSFQNIITVCNKEKVDLLLIAGDLFHRQPLVRELKEVNYYFSKLENTQIVMMAGNHDFIGARSCYQGFEWDDKVHMFLEDRVGVTSFDELETDVYGLSYHTRDITEPLYDNIKLENKNPENINSKNNNPENNFENKNPENKRFHILLAHGGDEKDIPINRKKLQDSGFDYIALGHIHKPEIINDKMAYCGSLEPIDKNELGERGYILGDITRDEQGNNRTVIRFVPSSTREYKRFDLNVDQETTNGSLLDKAREIIAANGATHIYSFCIQGVRDEMLHFDKESLKSLGNVLEVEDRSIPDYDFDALYKENADNMIGMFIKRIRENAKQDEIARKALYYGIEALLGAKDL